MNNLSIGYILVLKKSQDITSKPDEKKSNSAKFYKPYRYYFKHCITLFSN